MKIKQNEKNSYEDKLFELSIGIANKLYNYFKLYYHHAGFDTKIDSDSFIKQIVFEFWYDNYTDKSPFTNIYAADKPIYPPEEDAQYTHNKRAYKKKITTFQVFEKIK